MDVHLQPYNCCCLLQTDFLMAPIKWILLLFPKILEPDTNGFSGRRVENMQTLCPMAESNPGPSCCEAKIRPEYEPLFHHATHCCQLFIYLFIYFLLFIWWMIENLLELLKFLYYFIVFIYLYMCVLFFTWLDWHLLNLLKIPICGTNKSLAHLIWWQDRLKKEFCHLRLGETIGYSHSAISQ